MGLGRPTLSGYSARGSNECGAPDPMDTRFLLLLGCFFLSGLAALLYQTAWTRELSFVFGTSELAVAAVLAAYMGGLALGAGAAARYATRLRRPVLVYGVLELAIALCALSVPIGIRLINSVYVGLMGGASELPEAGATAAALFQLATAFAVLLPPTAFMGATLPAHSSNATCRCTWGALHAWSSSIGSSTRPRQRDWCWSSASTREPR